MNFLYDSKIYNVKRTCSIDGRFENFTDSANVWNYNCLQPGCNNIRVNFMNFALANTTTIHSETNLSLEKFQRFRKIIQGKFLNGFNQLRNRSKILYHPELGAIYCFDSSKEANRSNILYHV